MAKIFAKFGAKRDENLGDLANRTSAINILLDRIKGSKESFSLEDLDLIKDIFSTDITTDTFTSAADATVKFTNPTTGENSVYEPLITLQNRFDRAYFTTSEPFFYGGSGLTARYLDNFQILRTVGTDSKSSFIGFDQYYDPITGRATKDPILGEERAIQIDNFWEKGDFVYGNKIVNKLLTSYGGVEWSGYYKTDISGEHSIRIRTTGFVKVEFDNKEAPDKGFSLLFGEADSTSATFQLNDLDFTNPGGLSTIVDQTRLEDRGIITDLNVISTTVLTAANVTYPPFTFTSATGSGGQITIRRDANGNVVTNLLELLSNAGTGYQIGDTLVIPGTSVGGGVGDDITITVSGTGGYNVWDEIAGTSVGILGNLRTIEIPLGNLIAYEPYKIRISFFIDEDAVSKMQEVQTTGQIDKTIVFERTSPNVTSIDFNYKFLYGDTYFDFYNIGDFKRFVDQSISLGGTRIGDTGAIGSKPYPSTNAANENYFAYANLNPIVSYYYPPIDKPVSQIKVLRDATFNANDISIRFPGSAGNNNVPNKNEGIEIGNYILGPGIPIGARVKSFAGAGVISDTPCTSNQNNQTISFISHKGLVAFGTGGRYSTDIISGGINESGFSLGERGIGRVVLKNGDRIIPSQANQTYLDFLLPSPNIGTNAVLQISRNSFGALVINVAQAGTGFTNYTTIDIPGSFCGQPGEIIQVEIRNLTDTYLSGEPQFIFTKDQIFKNSQWTQNFVYTDETNPDAPVNITSSNSAFIDRVQLSTEVKRSLTNNSFVFSDQTFDVTSLDNTTNREWYVYQSYGLNNDALAPYCLGVYAKRILQKLTVLSGGSGHIATFTDNFDGTQAVSVSGGSGNNMKIYYQATNGVITHAWVFDAGDGYETGDVITVTDGTATLRVGYPSVAVGTSVTLRLEDAKDLSNGQFVHLFPSIKYIGTDINLLTSDVTITNIDWQSTYPNDPGAYVTITTSSGDVLTQDINFVPSVITKITVSPTNINKEVCFRPTDTSPPFSATPRGLSTSNDVNMVLDFGGSLNSNAKLSFDSLEIETDRVSNEIGAGTGDTIDGSFPIETPSGTYHILFSIK